MGIEEEIVPKQRYNECKTWQEKVILISLYYNLKSINNIDWFIKDTASYFDISSGLVSESLRLATEIDNPAPGYDLMLIKTREEALTLIGRRNYTKNRHSTEKNK